MSLYNLTFITITFSIIVVYFYVFVRPWFKGTMVKDTNPDCAAPGQCPAKSWCCRDPDQKEGTGYCTSKKCSDIRLENPTDDEVTFFNRYSISMLIVLTVIMGFKLIY